MKWQQMTTPEGVLSAECDDDDTVTLTLDRDDGETITLAIPAFKFQWIVDAFNAR